MKIRRILAVVAAATVGCSQVTTINTDPQGAKVWVNEEFLGVSPAELRIKDGPAVPFPQRLYMRLERAGHEPLEQDLPTEISGGRVAAGIFTVGLAFVLQGVRVVREKYVYAMYPLGTTQSEISEDWMRSVRELDKLHRDGLLTDEEYQRRRSILLRDMPKGTGDRLDTY